MQNVKVENMQGNGKSAARHTRKGEAADEKTGYMPFPVSVFWETEMFHACCVCAPCLLRSEAMPIAFLPGTKGMGQA